VLVLLHLPRLGLFTDGCDGHVGQLMVVMVVLDTWWSYWTPGGRVGQVVVVMLVLDS